MVFVLQERAAFHRLLSIDLYNQMHIQYVHSYVSTSTIYLYKCVAVYSV